MKPHAFAKRSQSSRQIKPLRWCGTQSLLTNTGEARIIPRDATWAGDPLPHAREHHMLCGYRHLLVGAHAPVTGAFQRLRLA
jgi:hypothetical protein